MGGQNETHYSDEVINNWNEQENSDLDDDLWTEMADHIIECRSCCERANILKEQEMKKKLMEANKKKEADKNKGKGHKTDDEAGLLGPNDKKGQYIGW